MISELSVISVIRYLHAILTNYYIADLLGVGHTYSPDSSQLSAAAAAGYPAQAMFPSNPYAAGIAHPAFTNPAYVFPCFSCSFGNFI